MQEQDYYPLQPRKKHQGSHNPLQDVYKRQVLAGDSVTYDAALGNSDMVEGDALKDGVALTFKAHAIQSKPFENAASAYLYIDADYIASTPSELEAAIENRCV